MAFSSKGTDEDIMAEINIVPLTDVMLVLLIIFMVATPLFVIESFKVDLPKAVTSSAEKQLLTNVTVTSGGEILVNGEKVEEPALVGSLKEELVKASSNGTVLLKGDSEASHGKVVFVLDAAREAGAERLSIATQPKLK